MDETNDSQSLKMIISKPHQLLDENTFLHLPYCLSAVPLFGIFLLPSPARTTRKSDLSDAGFFSREGRRNRR